MADIRQDLVSTHEEFSSVWLGRKTTHTRSTTDQQALVVIQQTFPKCLWYARRRASCLQQAVWPSRHVHVLDALCSYPPLLSPQTRGASLVMWALVKLTCLSVSSQLLAGHPLSRLKDHLLLEVFPGPIIYWYISRRGWVFGVLWHVVCAFFYLSNYYPLLSIIC